MTEIVDVGDLPASVFGGSHRAELGDINGDGLADFAISGSGGHRIVFGQANPYAPPGEVADADAFGFTIIGAYAIAAAGDVNGDGFDDIVLGNSGDDAGGTDAGAAYVVFGSAAVVSPDLVVDVEALNGEDGFKIIGDIPDSGLGWAVSGAGDVNGDGFNDLVLAAPNKWSNDYYNETYYEYTYVIYGRMTFESTLLTAELTPDTGSFLDYGGNEVSAAGDVNGDGYGDFLVGDQYTFFGPGGEYKSSNIARIVFGAANFEEDRRVDTISRGTRNDQFGHSLDQLGDFNGDGRSDIIIAGYRSFGQAYTERYSEAFVFFGTNAAPYDFTTSNLDGSNGFKIVYDPPGNYIAVSAAGDFNDDGLSDLLVTAASQGVWLLYGRSAAGPATINLSDLDPTLGFKISGVSYNMNAAGDVNGDGADDILVQNASSPYNTHLIYGAPSAAVDRTGTADADLLFAGAADDRLVGLAGDDLLAGASGANTLEGGDGDDTLSSGEGADASSGGDGQDRVSAGRGANTVSGGEGGDWIEAGDGSDSLTGDGGADWIEAGDGANTVSGGDGADTIRSGLGGDLLYGDTAPEGSGADLIDAGVGDDTLFGGDGDDSLLAGDGADYVEGGFGNDSIAAGEGDDRVLAGRGNNLVDAGGGDDQVGASDGHDTVVAGAGADSVESSVGDDSLSGGDGDDSLGAGVGADWADGGLGHDLIRGDKGDDTLLGALGNDTLSGAEGVDLLSGGDGDDVLRAAEGRGTLEGGIGDDYLRSGADADSLTGGDGDDTLISGNSADTLSGGLGDDEINAGDGRDVILGGLGADSIDGGLGFDRLSYAGIAAAVSVDLAASSVWVGGVKQEVSGVEAVTTSAGHDTLRGGASADALTGGLGDDVFVFSAGADTLDAGEGQDTLDAGAATAAVVVDLTAGTARQVGAPGLQRLTGFEAALGGAGADALTGDLGANRLDGGEGADTLAGGDGADTLLGGTGADSIAGGAGDDSIVGALEPDTIDGGSGFDRLDLRAIDVQTYVDLFEGRLSVGEAVQSLASVEWLSTGDQSDQVTGDDGANRIEVGGGADRVVVTLGQDTLDGGAGSDTLDLQRLSQGAKLQLSIGRLVVDGVEQSVFGFETVVGGGGGDTIHGGHGSERLKGGAGDDVIFGVGGRDTLEGGDGDDRLEAGPSPLAQRLSGDAGNDALYAGPATGVSERDTLAGGSGADRFIFKAPRESPPGLATRTLILDFEPTIDRIDLRSIDARPDQAGDQAFLWLGLGAFTGAAGELRYSQGGGATFVAADLDGDTAADFQVELFGTLTLTATDFQL